MTKSLIFICLLSSQAFGNHTEKLSVENNCVYVISSFDDVDYFSTFSRSGEFAWELPFSSKIESWIIEEDQLFIFSQSRDHLSYYLSCIDPVSGKVNWEKGIFSPK